MTKARENSDYTGLVADIVAGDTAARAGRKNIISNGSFQISQRGNYTSTTTATDNTFYVDRFRTVAGSVNVSNQHTTVSIGGVSKRAYRVTATSAATGYFGSRHGIELLDLEVGATYTISCWMRSNKSNARIRQDTIGATSADSTMSHTGGGDWEKITFTVDSTNTVANCALQFICYPVAAVSVGDYIEIADVQMEVGSVATDFEHRSYGEELALCQRYYEIGRMEGCYQGMSSVTAYTQAPEVQFVVPKRATPTLVLKAYSTNTVGRVFNYYGGADSVANSITSWNLFDTGFIARNGNQTLSLSGSGTQSAGNYCWTAEAEL